MVGVHGHEPGGPQEATRGEVGGEGRNGGEFGDEGRGLCEQFEWREGGDSGCSIE